MRFGMFGASVGHVIPNAGATCYTFFHVCFLINFQAFTCVLFSWAVFSPMLVLYIFVIDVLFLSAKVRPVLAEFVPLYILGCSLGLFWVGNR
jgi:hypothetical protein